MPYGDCILSVHHSKRTVNLLRTGEKGSMISGITENRNKIHHPEFERGWTKVTHTSIHRVNVKVEGGNPSINARRELGFPYKRDEQITFDQACIGFCHDLAYEIARSQGNHIIEWQLHNPTSGNTLTCRGEWQGEEFKFKLSNS